MAAAVGVEGAEQALRHHHLGQTAEAGRRPLLLDQERRIDRGGGVVEGDHQVKRRGAVEPGVPRGVLVQQHARQQPARPLLAVRRPPRRRLHQSRPVQVQLGHRVAELVWCRRHRRRGSRRRQRCAGIASAVCDRRGEIKVALSPQTGVYKSCPASVHVNQQVHLDLLPIDFAVPQGAAFLCAAATGPARGPWSSAPGFTPQSLGSPEVTKKTCAFYPNGGI